MNPGCVLTPGIARCGYTRSIRSLLIAGTLGLLATSKTLAAEFHDLVRQAQAALRTNATEALRLADRVVEMAPENGLSWYLRAVVRDSRREYTQALEDLSKALQIAPKAADAWQLRGEVNFKLGRFKDSVADFDKFLEIVPGQRAHHWQRGISLYYAGEFVEGRKQFEQHQTVNPADVENAVWHFLCVARKEGVTRAKELLLKTGPDSRVPMREIYDLFAGKGKASDVLTAVNRGEPNEAQRRERAFYAHLYLGLYFDATGDEAAAREHIRTAEAQAPKHYMGDVARIHARFRSLGIRD